MDEKLKYSQLDASHCRRSHNIFKDIINQYSKEECPKIFEVGCASGIIGMLKGCSKNIYGIEREVRLIEKAKKNCEKVFRQGNGSYRELGQGIKI